MKTTSGWRMMAAVLAAAVALSWGCTRGGNEASEGVAAALESVVLTPEQEAQAAVEGLQAALRAGRLADAYAMLPESYRSDIADVVSAYAGKIDADLFKMGVETLGAFGAALSKQAENVVSLLDTMPLPFELDGDAQAALDEAFKAGNLRLVGDWLAACPEWLDYGKLSKGDLSGLLGNAKVADFVRAAVAEGESKGAFAVRLAEQAAETAGTVMLEVGSEADGFETFEVVKVDGRWVAKELADEWQEGIQKAKEAVSEFTVDEETLKKARKMLPALKRAMATWGESESGEELMGNVMGTMMTLGAMAGM